MEFLKAGYVRLLGLCGLVAGLSIGLMALGVTIDVAIRNLGIGNFPWLIEVAEYQLYVATFLATPWVLHQGGHVRVDLLLTALPEKGARVLEAVVDTFGLSISGVLCYYGLAATLDAGNLGSLIFKELVVAEWWVLAVIPATTALLCIEFALRILRVLSGAAKADEEPGKSTGF